MPTPGTKSAPVVLTAGATGAVNLVAVDRRAQTQGASLQAKAAALAVTELLGRSRRPSKSHSRGFLQRPSPGYPISLGFEPARTIPP